MLSRCFLRNITNRLNLVKFTPAASKPVRFLSDIVEKDSQDAVEKLKEQKERQERHERERAKKKAEKAKKQFSEYFKDEERKQSLIDYAARYFDDNVKEKTAENFKMAIDVYLKTNPNKNLCIDFIFGALLKMKEYNAEKDIDAYKKLLGVFPEGPFVINSLWKRDNMHFPRHQNCALQIFEQMERNAVAIDEDMVNQAIRVFGDWTHVVRKAKRQLYWIPKFRFANRYPVPEITDVNDKLQLAMAALKRMSTVDMDTQFHVKYTKEIKNDQEDTWIAWCQSTEQKELLKNFDQKMPIYAEGPFFTWVKTNVVEYFLLKSDPLDEYNKKIKDLKEYDENDITNLENPFENPFKNSTVKTKPKISVHEQNTGIIFAMCCTGTSTKNSIITWTKLLEETNESLKDFAIIYRVKDKPNNLVEVQEESSKSSSTSAQ